jgi:HD-GYP domain-containing protein (c-di-GMP phosphodiesterase class II)
VGARIFAIADAFEAITTDRPQHRSRPLNTAREEIARSSGKHFDPKIVGVFLEMPGKIWSDLRREIDGPNVN